MFLWTWRHLVLEVLHEADRDLLGFVPPLVQRIQDDVVGTYNRCDDGHRADRAI